MKTKKKKRKERKTSEDEEDKDENKEGEPEKDGENMSLMKRRITTGWRTLNPHLQYSLSIVYLCSRSLTPGILFIPFQYHK